MCAVGWPYTGSDAPINLVVTNTVNDSIMPIICLASRLSTRFTKAQKRKFFHTMKAQKSYYVSATAVIIENRNTVYETANWTLAYTIRAMYSISQHQ